MRRRNGFSLIELLVVIAIIAILAAIIFPVYAQAKKSAYKSSDLSNMNSLRTALQLYKADSGSYPPALLGYVGPYESGSDMNNVTAAGNVLPPASIRDALYSKRVESLSVFRPALNRVPDNAGPEAYNKTAIEAGSDQMVTAAYWPQGDMWTGDSHREFQRFGPSDGFVKRAYNNGSGCQVVPSYYYRLSGYDVAPASNLTGAKMETHYQLWWSAYTVSANPCDPTADGTGGSASDSPRQLGYTDPPETTVVTWNPFFRDYTNGSPGHIKQDLVLFLGGNARPMDSAYVATSAWAVKP